MDQLRALRYFSKVVETGSFTRAAEAFSVPPSSLSRRIADLEKTLADQGQFPDRQKATIAEAGAMYVDELASQGKPSVKDY
ncbi:MAG: LysR family transcriptional regulator, partial [Porticoccaceae bacterium]